ncbi:MAG: ATP-binding protein [Candidatus Limnocylindrales bacterium]
MPRARFLPAVLVAVALGAAALGLRLLSPGDGTGAEATDLLRLLIVGASLCIAALLRRRAPAGAWLATVGAGGLAALEVVGVVRGWLPSAGTELSSWLVLLAEAGLVGAASIAGAYAIRALSGFGTPGAPWARWARSAIVAGWVAVVAVAVWAIPMPLAGDPSPLRVSGRLAAGFVAIAGLIGLRGDLAAPIHRARARTTNLLELPRLLLEELLPGSEDMRRRLREEERAQLAADLHARVLPDLRRAADAADAADAAGAVEANRAASDSVGSGLRQTLENVEQLMHARQSVVLEEYGLVAALEWLAERTQGRNEGGNGGRPPLVVDLELDGSTIDDPASVPKPVARAAFRVALLALDNVVRHAAASRAALRLMVDAGRLWLTVSDDGRGFDPGVAARGGRGLTDMRSAAAEIGAHVSASSSERGTEIELTWSVAGDHAMGSGGSPARPGRSPA